MSEGMGTAIKRLWAWFWRPSTRYALGFLLIVGVVVGGGGVIALNMAIGHTNSLEFCTGCHEMADNPLTEYQKTPHYNNRTGVRVTCPDCHVPHSGLPMLMAKLAAANDVLHTILGTINTPEKFETHRLAMAESVWAKMKATDSRECRSCHKFEAMDFELQDNRSAKKHQKAMVEKGTCIDCHKGIAHKKPSAAD